MVVKNKQKNDADQIRTVTKETFQKRNEIMYTCSAVISASCLYDLDFILFKRKCKYPGRFCRTVYYGDGRIWHLSGRYRTERKR